MHSLTSRAKCCPIKYCSVKNVLTLLTIFDKGIFILLSLLDQTLSAEFCSKFQTFLEVFSGSKNERAKNKETAV